MLNRSLIELLADGEFHSGEQLGAQLSISRAAVWAQVRELRRVGVPVFAVRGRGYQVPGGLHLLGESGIRRGLTATVNGVLREIAVLDVVDSTSAVAASRARDGVASGYVCVAEFQTAGRGRRGRAWCSPYAANIYMSIVWEFDGGFALLDGLSLVVGAVLAEALDSFGIKRCGLKWPNDLVIGGAKVGGVLIEVVAEPGGPCRAVIGIGINVGMAADAGADIGQPWTDLVSQGMDRSRRSELVAVLLNHLVPNLQAFSVSGFESFRDRWSRFDVLADAEVVVHSAGGEVMGVARGVDSSGGLIVALPDTSITLRSGEVSVRKWPHCC